MIRSTAEINKIIGQRGRLLERLQEIQGEIEQFQKHLQSAKFQGTEKVIAANGTVVEERKDWIATADVLRWLDGLASLTGED